MSEFHQDFRENILLRDELLCKFYTTKTLGILWRI